MECPKRLTKFHLFNCDNTYNLDLVEALLLKIAGDHSLKILVEKKYFRLGQMLEMCEPIIHELQMDFAVFVVHAQESRLTINEELTLVMIGYARLYRALLKATGRLNKSNQYKQLNQGQGIWV